MEYGISGLPGSGKTLNTIKMVVTEPEFANREIYYHGIPVLMLDYQVCCSFQGWFYGWFLHHKSTNSALTKKVSNIHKKESRLIEAEDFPYLEVEHKQSNPVEIWLYWVRRAYGEERIKVLDEYITVCDKVESDLSFDDLVHLNLHWSKFDNPKSWVDLPNQSVIVMDEIHHYWPTRTRGDVPPELEAISTHRHTGKDLILITQDFANVDVFIRRMMNYHTHFEFAGANRIACFKRKKYIETSNPFEKKAADKSLLKRPTHLYGCYYSTELDTNNNKLSKKARNGFILAGVSIVVFLLVVFIAFPMVFNFFWPDDTPQESSPPAAAAEQTNVIGSGPSAINVYQPAYDVYPWTAPIYKDSLTPASYPSLMCFVATDTCTCLTQQSTVYAIDDTSCRLIATNGLFDPHRADPRQSVKRQSTSKGGLF